METVSARLTKGREIRDKTLNLPHSMNKFVARQAASLMKHEQQTKICCPK